MHQTNVYQAESKESVRHQRQSWPELAGTQPQLIQKTIHWLRFQLNRSAFKVRFDDRIQREIQRARGLLIKLRSLRTQTQTRRYQNFTNLWKLALKQTFRTQKKPNRCASWEEKRLLWQSNDSQRAGGQIRVRVLGQYSFRKNGFSQKEVSETEAKVGLRALYAEIRQEKGRKEGDCAPRAIQIKPENLTQAIKTVINQKQKQKQQKKRALATEEANPGLILKWAKFKWYLYLWLWALM